MSAGPAIVLGFEDADHGTRCLRALAASRLPSEVRILAGGPADVRASLEGLDGSAVGEWLDAEGAALINAAASRVAGDLVLLGGASEVGRAWYEDFRAVAAAHPDAATITALSNDAAFLSVPRRNLPWPLPPSGLTAQDAAARVRAGAVRARPHTPTALPHAVFLRRAALDLVGGLDEGLPLGEALADFSVRCCAAGLANIVADEIFVAHRGDVPEHDASAWEGQAAQRHPALAAGVRAAAEDRHSALARALLSASVTLEPLTVTIDARHVGGTVTGTVVHAVELVGALAERSDVRVRALLPDRVGEDASRALDRVVGLERILGDDDRVARTHIAHRPWQVESVQDLAVLDRLGERTVITHQDLIGYRTPAVFGSVERWEDYRRTTRDALGLAATVLFFSEAAAGDAAADDLVAPERARVVPIGAVPRLIDEQQAAQRPPQGFRESGRPFLLMLGSRFRHKNTGFALELLAALRTQHGWDGELVLAGAETLHGSSSADDARWLLERPAHADAVQELGAVSQAEKAWLLGQAAAVVYPSTYEGFGLVPFEAAMAGTPCLVAPVSALRETVPVDLALLRPWDASASAAAAAGVLRDGTERTRLVDGLRAVAGALTWEAAAERVVDAYRSALRLPAPPSARLAADLARAEHDYWSVRDGIPDPVWELVRPDAPLIDVPLAENLGAALRGGRRRLVRAVARLGGRAPRGR